MNIKHILPLGILSALVGCTTPDLQYHQNFDDAALEASSGTWSAGKIGAGEIVEGKIGKALHVKSGKPGAMVEIPAGSIGKRGCIEFWAKLDGGKKKVQSSLDPMFFSVNADGSGRIGLGFTTNEGHGDSGLQYHFWGVAYSASHRGCSTHDYSEILKGDPAAWHHYALVWNFDETDAAYDGAPVVVYIDGKPRYTAGKPSTVRAYNKHTGWLAAKQTLDFSYATPSHSGYTIDEVKVWSTDKRPLPAK